MVYVRKSECKEMKKKKDSKAILQKKSIEKSRKGKKNVKKEDSYGSQTQKQLNTWDFYYEEDQRNFNGKIKFWGDINVPQIICDKLNSEQIDLLKATVFGQFVNFEKRRLFTQIIHQGLTREIHQTKESEIWFLFGEERSRFSLEEFCIISGLKGSGSTDLSQYEGVQNQFLSKFFPEEKVNRSLIKKKFDDAVFESNEEALRLSLIFLVFNFLLATVEENVVDRSLLNFMSCGDINSFPWGKVGFEMLIKSLRNALKGKVEKVDRGVFKYNFFKESDCRYYKLSGLVYVFQVFLFETIVDLKQKGFCTDDQQSNVRMFKWSELGNLPQLKKLRNNVFGTKKMSVQLIVPTNEEIERSELDEFQFPKIVNNKSGTKAEKNKQGAEAVDISDINELIDSRVNPIKRKMKLLRKEVKDFRIQIRSEMEEFQNGIRKMVEEALQKVLIGLKDSENKRNQEAANDSVHGDSGASKYEDKDVSIGHTDHCAGGNVPTVEEEDNTEMDVDDNKAAENEGKGMEIILYTPEQAMKNVELQEEVEGLDINFNTQEIIEIDEVIRSFSKGKSIPVQPVKKCRAKKKPSVISKGRRMPVRVVKKSQALRTPFTANIRSEAAPSKVAKCKNPIEWTSALTTVCMQMPSESDIANFDSWFKIGLNKRKRYEKFPGDADVITPPFTYGGVQISSKMWFYRLLTPGQFMDNNHIDICFYFLRKLARNSMMIPIRVTTTDCWFNVLISGLYKAYNDNDLDESILTSDEWVVSYICGTAKMSANTRWFDVDHVLFPIHMNKPEHWIMLAFDVSRRRLVAYNSFQNDGTQMRDHISDVCEPYIYILPIILSKCGFWRSRNDIERNSSAYVGVGECDHIELEIAKGLPEQVESDCGMFTICFAEHYIHQRIHQIPQPFPVPEYRKKLAANLYQYAHQKLSAEYDSGSD